MGGIPHNHSSQLSPLTMHEDVQLSAFVCDLFHVVCLLKSPRSRAQTQINELSASTGHTIESLRAEKQTLSLHVQEILLKNKTSGGACRQTQLRQSPSKKKSHGSDAHTSAKKQKTSCEVEGRGGGKSVCGDVSSSSKTPTQLLPKKSTSGRNLKPSQLTGSIG